MLFGLTHFLIIGRSHHSNADFFTPLSYLLWRLSFRSYTNFFPSVSHLVDNYAKIVDERGRKLMCDRTIPSRLVYNKYSNDSEQLNLISVLVQIEIRRDHVSNPDSVSLKQSILGFIPNSVMIEILILGELFTSKEKHKKPS